jgi:hypothetical protein
MPDQLFDWFTRWVNQYLCVTLTFATGRSWQEMATCFGAAPTIAGTATFLEAALRDGTNIRLGTAAPWAYAVVDSVHGGDWDTLGCLSRNRGDAFSLCYTETIDTFLYANDGRSIFGFDTLVPHIRYGEEPQRFSAELEQAGFLDDGIPTRGMGAKFIELAFGITLDHELLERPLPMIAVG